MAASAYHLISKDVENHLVRRNSIFRDTSIYKQLILTKQCNYHIFVQILYSYLRYTVRLLDVFFLLLLVIFLVFLAIRVSLETKKKRLSCKNKVHRRICRGMSLFWLHVLLVMLLLSLFVYSDLKKKENFLQKLM